MSCAKISVTAKRSPHGVDVMISNHKEARSMRIELSVEGAEMTIKALQEAVDFVRGPQERKTWEIGT